MSQVRVIWTLSEGCLFRAPPVTAAFDSAHHVAPQDLDLLAGRVNLADQATVDYWATHTHGLRWERVGDKVVVSQDEARPASAPRAPRNQRAANDAAPTSPRRSIKDELREIEARSIKREIARAERGRR